MLQLSSTFCYIKFSKEVCSCDEAKRESFRGYESFFKVFFSMSARVQNVAWDSSPPASSGAATPHRGSGPGRPVCRCEGPTFAEERWSPVSGWCRPPTVSTTTGECQQQTDNLRRFVVGRVMFSLCQHFEGRSFISLFPKSGSLVFFF